MEEDLKKDKSEAEMGNRMKVFHTVSLQTLRRCQDHFEDAKYGDFGRIRVEKFCRASGIFIQVSARRKGSRLRICAHGGG